MVDTPSQERRSMGLAENVRPVTTSRGGSKKGKEAREGTSSREQLRPDKKSARRPFCQVAQAHFQRKGGPEELSKCKTNSVEEIHPRETHAPSQCRKVGRRLPARFSAKTSVVEGGTNGEASKEKVRGKKGLQVPGLRRRRVEPWHRTRSISAKKKT